MDKTGGSCISVASLAAAMLIAAPLGASAATQIGETFVPTTSGCTGNQTFLQSTSPGNRYAAPTAGVITRWSYQADNENPAYVDKLKFKVARPAPGANLTMSADFTMIGESALVDPVFDTLNSYFIRIPVQAGDVIGFYHDPGNSPVDCWLAADASYGQHYGSGDVVPPTTTTFSQETEFQQDISALLEPDCDNDGFGDETQDTNLPTPPCPTALTCKGQRLTIVGTNGSDEVVGTATRDVIGALDGNDRVSGLTGNDLICGGRGKDTLAGGKGKDKLLGQAGKDKLRGGGAKDICKGGKGNDSGSCEVEKSV